MRAHTKKRGRGRSRSKQRGGAAPATAVIVEPRRHRALPFVLHNMLEGLPANWSILIIHGTRNGTWLNTLLRGQEFSPAERARMQTVAGGFANLNQQSYSDLLLQPEFWRALPTEQLLIFQTDSMICLPHKDLLQKFLHYDYVGAPWPSGHVGNGGFSLRQRSKMLEILERCKGTWDPRLMEDGVFIQGCATARATAPGHEEAREFSIEGLYSQRAFGLHKPWTGMLNHKEGLDAVERVCPGMKKLMSLQGEE